MSKKGGHHTNTMSGPQAPSPERERHNMSKVRGPSHPYPLPRRGYDYSVARKTAPPTKRNFKNLQIIGPFPTPDQSSTIPQTTFQKSQGGHTCPLEDGFTHPPNNISKVCPPGDGSTHSPKNISNFIAGLAWGGLPAWPVCPREIFFLNE